ncbi:DsbA family protein [Silvanigrella aquatica]|uniref:Thioredoxin domain-containing protein n=1 Tax=Silvanigrella aquatica TaxID=1915309 RepID=A0A1L4D1Y8_9BACT|nr:thioredoxin domain-containing protein [Silvanigrella aquatica]APJ04204.1 hypothetical protein AXG55_09915 [Silvanigrella aquatica]
MKMAQLKISNKWMIMSALASMAIAVSSCQTRNNSQIENNNQTFGMYNGKAVTFAELTQGEKSEIINAQKKVYETAQNILEKYYLDSWFFEYQKKNNLNTLDDAKKDYFSKNVKIDDLEVQSFIKQNANNPQMQQIPEKERVGLVKQYMTRVAQAKEEQSLLQNAEEQGKIKLVGIEKPSEIVVQFKENGYKYDDNLTQPKITIVEFADYQCPYCVQAHSTIEKLLSSYKGKVQYIFKDFPLTEIHPEAMPAAIAAKCAGNQGKYWEMHKLLFSREPSAPLSANLYESFADQLKLNINDFKSCREDKSSTISKSIHADIQEGNDIGINATPSLFINGQKYEGNMSFDGLKKEIDTRLAVK